MYSDPGLSANAWLKRQLSKKTAGFFMAVFLGLTAPVSAGYAKDEVPTVEIPITSMTKNVENAPHPGERFGQFLDRVSIKGPAKIVLQKEAMFDLPAGYKLVPDDSAAVIFGQIDGMTSPAKVLGLIFSDTKSIGYILIEYYSTNHVPEEGFKKVDAASTISKMKSQNEIDNDQRRKAGNPSIDIVDWKQKPTYDSTTNRISFSTISQEDPPETKDDPNISYDIDILSRHGIYALTLATDLKSFDKRKAELDAIAKSFRLEAGSGYKDFDPKLDLSSDGCDFEIFMTKGCEAKNFSEPAKK